MKNIVFGFSLCFATVSWAMEPTTEKFDRLARLEVIFTENERAKREAEIKTVLGDFVLCLAGRLAKSSETYYACDSLFQGLERLGLKPEEFQLLKQQLQNPPQGL